MERRQGWRAALAISLVVAGVTLWQVALNSRDEGPDRILVTKVALPAGAAILPQDVRLEPGHGEKGYVTDQQVEALKRMRLAQPVGAGKAVRWTDLVLRKKFSYNIPKGYRAYLIPQETSLRVKPEDRLDLLLASDRGVRTVAEGLIVLSVLPSVNGRRAVVAVDSHQLNMIERSKSVGNLTLVLRNPDDEPPARVAGRTPKPSKKARKQIEILTEEQ